MPEFAVTAVGRDRPGIVAAISGALFALDGNVEDSRMSILRGHFAVMLIVEVPDGAREDLERELDKVRDELDLEAVAVDPVAELDGRAAPATHVLSVYGADRPGIVYAISKALADQGVNITDLETRVTGSAQAPVYVMLLEVGLDQSGEDQVASALREAAGRSGVEVSLRALEAESL